MEFKSLDEVIKEEQEQINQQRSTKKGAAKGALVKFAKGFTESAAESVGAGISITADSIMGKIIRDVERGVTYIEGGVLRGLNNEDLNRVGEVNVHTYRHKRYEKGLNSEFKLRKADAYLSDNRFAISAKLLGRDRKYSIWFNTAIKDIVVYSEPVTVESSRIKGSHFDIFAYEINQNNRTPIQAIKMVVSSKDITALESLAEQINSKINIARNREPVTAEQYFDAYFKEQYPK